VVIALMAASPQPGTSREKERSAEKGHRTNPLPRVSHGTPPDEPSIAAWQRIASHINHWGLYLLLLLVPIGGLFGILLYPSLDIFSVTLPALLSPDRDAAERVFYWHMVGAFGIVVLAGIHAIAAAYHYYMRRDGVLRRMLLRAGRYSLEAGHRHTG
jgi:cytochrome b561